MTTSVSLPTFVSRREGEGYVVYLPDAGIYLYANASAHEVLTELRTGRSLNEVAAALSAQHSLAADQVNDVLSSVIDVLQGRRGRTDAADTDAPQVCPLSDLVGDSADRCETFGMPL